MTYDLRRLRLKGIVHRLPGTHRYVVTTYGLKCAFFFTKLNLRILRPGFAAIGDDNDIAGQLKTAYKNLDAAIDTLCDQARLEAA